MCRLNLICCEGKKGYPCFKLDLDTADRCMNSSKKARQHPPLSDQSRQLLTQIFTPSIKKFNQETGMNIRLM